jgi:hypothetical protein
MGKFNITEDANMNKAFFYSAYLFVYMSDALFYVPGITKEEDPDVSDLVDLKQKVYKHAPILLWNSQMDALYSSLSRHQ